MGGKPKGTQISQRKQQHIAIAASGQASFTSKKTLLNEVGFIHNSLPELALNTISLKTPFLGKTLSLPMMFSGMTGGTKEARAINRDLAKAAQKFGVAMGIGSQRAMMRSPELVDTYAVRELAPDVPLVGNLGVVQAYESGVTKTLTLATKIGMDALAIHLNPAQEMIQTNGDRDFRHGLEIIEKLVKADVMPIIVKETGCGLSAAVAKKLYDVGVRIVDVSGAGGTSWTAVESLRAPKNSLEKSLGETFWNWGIPTAASTAACHQAGLQVIATGGLKNGLDIARAGALGASLGGMAAAALRAQRNGGVQGVYDFLELTRLELQTTCLLTGTSRFSDLRNAPRVLGPSLRRWMDGLSIR